MANPLHRQPAGTPQGGQFAPGSQDRSSIVLTENADGVLTIDMATALNDEDYNRTGSYAHPPIPRNAKQVIKFWLSTPIPDRVLDQVSAAYATRSAQLREVQGGQRGGLLRKARPEQSDAPSSRPEELPPYLLADVVRLGCMYRQSGALEQDQANRLVDADFTLNTGAMAMSPRTAWEYYDLASIEGAFNDTYERDRDAREDLQAWNLHADLIGIRNKLVPPGEEREDTSWVPYGGVTP